MQASVALVAAVALGIASVVAQDRGEGLVEITRAEGNESVYVMGATHHGCVPYGDDGAFVLVHRLPISRARGDDGSKMDLELWRAHAGGATWRRVGVAPTRFDGEGSIVRDGSLLAVCWSSCDGKRWSDAWFQRFDPEREAWIGEPLRLTDATGEVNQHFVTDLARAANGALVAVVGCDGPLPFPLGNFCWSTGVRILPAGSSEWTPMQKANDTILGVCGNALVRGDRVDVTYRTNPSAAAHGLRMVDVTKAELLPPMPPITSSDPADDEQIANVGLWCGDDVGGRTLLFLRGAQAAGKGRLSVAHDRGDGVFVVCDVADDPALVAGNETNEFFTLARGHGDQAHVCFAKRADDCTELWHATLSGGEVVRAPRVVARIAPQAFAALNGMRAPDAASTMLCVIGSLAAEGGAGVVRAYGRWPLRNVAPRPGR